MNRKPSGGRLTPLELEIMEALWRTGPATVQVIRQELTSKRPLAYTTVQTMLNILHRKRKVKRKLKGKAYEYAPVVSRQAAVHQSVRDLVNRLFDGSAETLVMSLVESKQLTTKELGRLSRLLEQARKDA
jgi:BlaI family transcriptional regulator, penicillinase repressor